MVSIDREILAMTNIYSGLLCYSLYKRFETVNTRVIDPAKSFPRTANKTSCPLMLHSSCIWFCIFILLLNHICDITHKDSSTHSRLCDTSFVNHKLCFRSDGSAKPWRSAVLQMYLIQTLHKLQMIDFHSHLSANQKLSFSRKTPSIKPQRQRPYLVNLVLNVSLLSHQSFEEYIQIPNIITMISDESRK